MNDDTAITDSQQSSNEQTSSSNNMDSCPHQRTHREYHNAPVSRNGSPTPLGSLSRPPAYKTTPRLVHEISTSARHSVLSLVCDSACIYSGQGIHINVYCLKSFGLVKSLNGHKGSVLDLKVDPNIKLLFSASADSSVRIWDTVSHKCLYYIEPSFEVGDIFSVAFAPSVQMAYFGCQNTSIQWFNFEDVKKTKSTDTDQRSKMYPPRYSKFFDDCSRNNSHSDLPGLASPVLSSYSEGDSVELNIELQRQEMVLQRYIMPATNTIKNAHYGYVYCMIVTHVPGQEKEVLISSSGDGCVKLWFVDAAKPPTLWQTLRGSDVGILSLTIKDGLLFAGAQDGDIHVWDLETFQHVRSILAHDDDVLSLSVFESYLFSCSADGKVKKWSQNYECLNTWKAHDGIILSSVVGNEGASAGASSPLSSATHPWLITGAGDNVIRIWDIAENMPKVTKMFNHRVSFGSDFFYCLEKFVSLKTVCGDEKHKEDCRLAAKFLQNVLRQLGASASILPNAKGGNPIVMGTFVGKQSTLNSNRPRVLVYGHYDVIPADESKWESPPFKLDGRNGYLYARGVTDNKGPVLTQIWAVSELVHEQSLDVDVVFLIEGEEERGSVGFFDAVHKHRDQIGHIDVIVVCNSYWLDDQMPCLTYGLRGVIHATINVKSNQADVHSGVEGGAISEPLIDLVKVISKLTDDKSRVRIDGFYDFVRPLKPHEEKLYEPIEAAFSKNHATHVRLANGMGLKESLMAKWRFPWLSVHKITVSGPNNSTVIPSCAVAKLSIRIVPDQEVDVISRNLCQFITDKFQEETTTNSVEVTIDHVADWWLGDVNSPYFKCAEAAIEKEWGVKPLYIREGGSITPLRWLEREFNAGAVHLPLGQSSDGAHLNNERIRLKNLQAGRRILKDCLKGIAKTRIIS